MKFQQADVQIIKKVVRYRGFFRIDEYHLRHPLYQGGYSNLVKREVLERGDAVVVVPYDPINDNVVLIEQFRVGAMHRDYSPWLLECIAGMIEPDEQPEQVAIREAKEEANLIIEAGMLIPMLQYLSSSGGTTEQIHLFLALVPNIEASGVYGLADENEDILVRLMPRTEALALLEQGKIHNAATVIGLQWLALHYQRWQTIEGVNGEL